jgi:hypothetical protein
MRRSRSATSSPQRDLRSNEMPAQSIRPSQFVSTYGPGSILEGPDGPRVVVDLANSGVFGSQSILSYVIQDAGLSQILPDQAQIVRLPTNAERQVRDSEHIYQTVSFPAWSLCAAHNIIYRYQHPNARTGCPSCPSVSNWGLAWRQSRQEAIRFVMACPSGHLDDVHWPGLVHHRMPGCAPSILHWEGGGGALRNVVITCPDCGGRVNLGSAYNRPHRCSGRYPERCAPAAGCQREARMMQRGAANLYVTDVVTAITIPHLDTTLHQALAMSQVRPALLIISKFPGITGAQVRAYLEDFVRQGVLPQRIIIEVRKYSDNMVLQAMFDVLSMQLPTTSEGVRLNEFRELQRAAAHGHPSQPSLTPGAPPMFEVITGNVRTDIVGPGGYRLRVAPVSRLRVLMVQKGYHRLDGGEQDVVSSMYSEGQNRWLPGVELHGEGIFVDLAPESSREFASVHIPLAGEDVGAWYSQWQRALGEDGLNSRCHPVFIWWHTLAHRLILALAVDSGYSSSAIRERVYVRIDSDTGNATGGVLLYTAQPGGDGTLGGLIALTPRFERVLDAALRQVDSCSNDPLCNEERYRPGRSNGAACYACSFISETSCEFRNMYLDRNVLRLHLP